MPPSIDDLMAAFLARRQGDMVRGATPNDGPEVGVNDPVPAQSVDPRMAWDAANEALTLLAPAAAMATKLPTGWSNLVGNLESMTGLPIAVGNYPQSVRDLLPLVRTGSLAATMKQPAAPTEDHGVSAATKPADPAFCLRSAAVLRLARRFDEASNMLAVQSFTADWAAAATNEQAALAWHRGQRDEAVTLWNQLPDSAVKSFNLGMAELFADRPASARLHLQLAIAKLSENSPWHHLGQLYLALAEAR